MFLHPRLVRSTLSFAFVLGGLAASGAAHAQVNYSYFQGGISTGLMATQNDSSHMGGTGWMLGYRFNGDVGVQAVGFGANAPFYRVPVANAPAAYDFTRFAGVQAVGYIQATSVWDIYGELGVGRASYGTLTAGASSQKKTDGIFGIGVRWQVWRHVGVSADFSRLMEAQATNGSLRAEFNF